MTSPLDPYANAAAEDACETEWCCLPDGHRGAHEDRFGQS